MKNILPKTKSQIGKQKIHLSKEERDSIVESVLHETPPMNVVKKDIEILKRNSAFMSATFHKQLKKAIDIARKLLDGDDDRAFSASDHFFYGHLRPMHEEVSSSEMKNVEKFADALFKELDIDVQFTKHFKDRVNDTRNHPNISAKELVDFFKKAFEKQGKNIASMTSGKEALLNDMQKKLNLPFVFKWDGKNFEFDLVAKTIMRKNNFKTSNKVLRF